MSWKPKVHGSWVRTQGEAKITTKVDVRPSLALLLFHPVYHRHPEERAPRAKTLLYKVASIKRGSGVETKKLRDEVPNIKQEPTNLYQSIQNSSSVYCI